MKQQSRSFTQVSLSFNPSQPMWRQRGFNRGVESGGSCDPTRRHCNWMLDTTPFITSSYCFLKWCWGTYTWWGIDTRTWNMQSFKQDQPFGAVVALLVKWENTEPGRTWHQTSWGNEDYRGWPVTKKSVKCMNRMLPTSFWSQSELYLLRTSDAV